MVKKELKRRMDLKKYPPRLLYEAADLTKCLDFFNRPRILEYRVKGGKIPTMDGDVQKNSGKIVIPILTG